MKKVVIFIAAILVVVTLLVVSMAAYIGMFSTVIVTQKKAGPYFLVYDTYTGPYKDSVNVQMRVYESLKADGIETVRGFGIYLSDPQKVSEAECKSEVGCIIEEKDYAKFKALAGKYKTKQFAQTECVYAEFPLKNNLSFAAGVIKVYPALGIYIKQKNLSDKTSFSMEVYDIPAKKILYLFPIVR